MIMKDMELLQELSHAEGETQILGAYGPHLLLDCHGCDAKKFNRKSINDYMKKLCKAIDMDAQDFHFWDDEGLPEKQCQTEPHAKGTSVGGVFKKKVGLQFIITSSIVIHTLDILERVYVDIFSCKLFDEGAAVRLTQEWFKAKSIGTHLIQRS